MNNYIDSVKVEIIKLSVEKNERLKFFLEKIEVMDAINTMSYIDKTQLLTHCAMLASKKGITENIKLLIGENNNLLQLRQCGVFRVTCDIIEFNHFKEVINYLLNDSNKSYIDVNALECAFLKECIKKEYKDKLQYLMETKKVLFNIDAPSIIKTLIRSPKNELFDYVVLQLKTPIENIDNYKTWAKENNYLEQWNCINKKNLLLILEKKLKQRHNQHKALKI